jgi:uncharacterized membrane protein
MPQEYTDHQATVTVNAPAHEVYSMFSHFNDFPKFMTFVKEVTYYDDQRSHWVASIAGTHEWDAVNENWVPDQQIGWRSTSGLDNFGKVTFTPRGTNQTSVTVDIHYDPPAGILGDAGEKLGVGRRFQDALQNDLNHFAQMVDEAPPGTLDPTASNYLFHQDSAAVQHSTTQAQNDTMYDDLSTTQKAQATQPASTSTNTQANDNSHQKGLLEKIGDRIEENDIDTGVVPVESDPTVTNSDASSQREEQL